MTDGKNSDTGHTGMKNAMLAATAGADPNIHTLIDRGVVRARQIRRRRRMTWAVGSTAAAVLVAGALAAADRHKTAAPPLRQTGIVDPASPAGVYDTLKTLLPAGPKLSGGVYTDIKNTVAERSLGAVGGITVSDEYLYDDGHGITELIVNIDGSGSDEYMQLSAQAQCSKKFSSARSCTVRKLTDGSVVQIGQDPTSAADPQGAMLWSVSLIRPDGTDVAISEVTAVLVNGGTMPSNKPTRATPPLSVDQLVVIADAPAWAPLGPLIRESGPTQLGPTSAASGPTHPDPASATAPSTPATDARRTTPRELAAVLKSLIPQGLPASDSDPGLNAEFGEGNVLVRDGHGDVRLTVHNAGTSEAPWACGTDTSGNQDSCRVVTLADGTVVQVTHYGQQNIPGGGGFGPGVEEWRAVAVRRSGVVVVLVELNTTAPAKPATRKDVPLSLDQLAAIAGDKAWDRFQGENPPPTFGATASPGYSGPGALDPGTPTTPGLMPTPAPSGG